MKPVKSTDIDYLYKIFSPQLSPKKMLELGVFGGSYFEGKIKEYPKSWFIKAKLSKTFDIKQNYFKVRAGLSREYWVERVGFLKKILWVGFNGIVDLQKEDAFLILMACKLKDGKILLGM